MDVDPAVAGAIFEFLRGVGEIDSLVESYEDVEWSGLIGTFQKIYGEILDDHVTLELQVAQMKQYLLERTHNECQAFFTPDNATPPVLIFFRCAQADPPPEFQRYWDELDTTEKELLRPPPKSSVWLDIQPTIESCIGFLTRRNDRLKYLAALTQDVSLLTSELHQGEGLSRDEIGSQIAAATEQRAALENEIVSLQRALSDGAPGAPDALAAEIRALEAEIVKLEEGVRAQTAQIGNIEDLRRQQMANAREAEALEQTAAEMKRLEDLREVRASACSAAERELALDRARTAELADIVAERLVAVRAARADAEFREKLDVIAGIRASRAKLRREIEGVKAIAPKGRSK